MDEKMSYKEFLDRNDSWSAEERDLCFKPMDMAGRMAQGPGASLILAAGGPHGLLAGVHSHPFLAPSLWGLLLPCLRHPWVPRAWGQARPCSMASFGIWVRMWSEPCLSHGQH